MFMTQEALDIASKICTLLHSTDNRHLPISLQEWRDCYPHSQPPTTQSSYAHISHECYSLYDRHQELENEVSSHLKECNIPHSAHTFHQHVMQSTESTTTVPAFAFPHQTLQHPPFFLGVCDRWKSSDKCDSYHAVYASLARHLTDTEEIDSSH